MQEVRFVVRSAATHDHVNFKIFINNVSLYAEYARTHDEFNGFVDCFKWLNPLIPVTIEDQTTMENPYETVKNANSQT